MKTSPNNPKLIEQYITDNLNIADTLLFKARLIIDPVLRLNLAMQRKTYELVRLFARRELKGTLEKTHQQIFQNPEKKAFQQLVLQLFTKP